MIRPSPIGSIGPDDRDDHGRFAKGNPGGPGNPHAKHIGQLRSALIAAVTEEDMKAIAAKLIEKAKGGDIHAVKELLTRTLGRPQEADLVERIERLEQAIAHRQEVGR